MHGNPLEVKDNVMLIIPDNVQVEKVLALTISKF